MERSFTWQGRQMASANLNGTVVTYKYNADGLRTYKKVGSTVSEYEYLGDKLIYEKRGNLQFHYRYDAYGNLGSITRINAAGSSYTAYVVCNSRGDVEEIRKADGTLYARYVYDSWGNTVKILDANGNTVTDPDYLSVQNPIRYRGYYWDSESGLYYLQSRYYDPVTGRFVNADSLVDTSNVLGFNMYAYCGNNPVNYSDPSGRSWTAAAVIGISGLVGGICSYNAGDSFWAGFAGGAAGGVAGLIVGKLGNASIIPVAGRAVSTLVSSAVTTRLNGDKFTVDDLVYTGVDILFDTTFSTIGYYYNNATTEIFKNTIDAVTDGMVDIIETRILYTEASKSNVISSSSSNVSKKRSITNARNVSNTRNEKHLTFMERRMNNG